MVFALKSNDMCVSVMVKAQPMTRVITIAALSSPILAPGGEVADGEVPSGWWGGRERGEGRGTDRVRTHGRHLEHRRIEKPVGEHRPLVIDVVNFDGEAGRSLQVLVGVLVHHEGSEEVLGDLLPVQPLQSVHVPCFLIDPEDLAGRLSSEQVPGILAVHTRFDLGKKRCPEPGRGGGVCVSYTCVWYWGCDTTGFESVAVEQYYISLRCTTRRSNIDVPCDVTATLSPVTTCHGTKLH